MIGRSWNDMWISLNHVGHKWEYIILGIQGMGNIWPLHLKRGAGPTISTEQIEFSMDLLTEVCLDSWILPVPFLMGHTLIKLHHLGQRPEESLAFNCPLHSLRFMTTVCNSAQPGSQRNLASFPISLHRPRGRTEIESLWDPSDFSGQEWSWLSLHCADTGHRSWTPCTPSCCPH